MNYGMRFVTLYRRQGSRPFPWKRNAKKQNDCLGRPCAEKRREDKSKGEKERYKHLNAEVHNKVGDGANSPSWSYSSREHRG